MSNNNPTNQQQTTSNPPSSDGGISSSLISPGLTSSLHGSATTFGTPRGTGFGSAFNSSSPYGTSPNGRGSGYIGTPGQGDKRTKIVRERSIRSATFANPGLVNNSHHLSNSAVKTSKQSANNNNVGKMKNITETTIKEDVEVEESSALFTSFCYKGMEVIFTVVNNSPTSQQLATAKDGSVESSVGDNKEGSGGSYISGIHSRTRVPFQKCYLDNNNKSSSYQSSTPKSKQTPIKIVAITSHPTNGYIYLCTNYGTIYSYYPMVANPMVYAYGKFRWKLGCIVNVREVFGYTSFSSNVGSGEVGAGSVADGAEDEVCFYRKGSHAKSTSDTPTLSSNTGGSNNSSPPKNNGNGNQTNYPLTNDGQPPLPKMNNNETHEEGDNKNEVHGSPVMICASMTEKRVLIVHRDQLAVYDFSLPSDSVDNNKTQPPEAFLLWTHTLQGSIIEHASISGDGCSIAVSLRGEGVGVPYPFGVRTFVRDWDDGSCSRIIVEDKKKTTDGGKSGVGGKPPMHRRTLSGPKPLSKHTSPPPIVKKRSTSDDGLLENVFGDASAAPPSTSNITAKSTTSSNPPLPTSPTTKQGILYKPAQFLVHSAPVSRLAFRGYGTITSSSNHNTSSYNDEEEEGNDLLLTTCSIDCSVRIFSQNSWRQLMHWNSPPKSRADWVRGISAANLGDLDSSPTSSGNNNSTTTTKKDQQALTPIPKEVMDLSNHSSSQHDNASMTSDTSGGINRALLANTKNHRGVPPPSSSFPSHSVPGTHAGAWIAELTFRNTFPALRLSRLSYMKTGGDDALPAHFESVAAILPPGSINENVVFDDGECQLEVEGIWPTWDPWEPDVKGSGGGKRSRSSSVGSPNEGGQDKSKLSSNPLSSIPPSVGVGSPAQTSSAPRWLGDGSDLGGSHMPPSELRLTSSHSCIDSNLTQIEMPLWGDKDFGAMEFGAPTRRVMTMPEEKKKVLSADLPQACLDYESGSRLCAQSSLDRRSIDLCWRKHGAVNLDETTNGSVTNVRTFQDLSLIPLPLSLPSLTLPNQPHSSSSNSDKHAISSLHWWPDENYGGPPRLVAATMGGTLIVYEMPPPWSALEPPMPAYDPFNDEDDDMSRGSSIDSDYISDGDGGGVLMDEHNTLDAQSFGENTTRSRTEYEVSILPHPDFGLGLRLESPAMEGMPAITGSFKKHPLSGGRLPAERLGVIAIGDELLAVNDVSLEGMNFEEAIGTVRQIGFDSYGAPLLMRFRRGRGRRKTSTLGSSGGSGSRRIKHTASTESKSSANDRGTNKGSGGSVATVEVGADSEIQQGYGRIIAIVRGVMVDSSSSCPSNAYDATPMLLVPWNFGKGATVSAKMYGGALILWAVPGQRRVIKVARLEAILDIDPENARFEEMGSISLDKDGGSSSTVKSISYISSTEKGWLVAVHDCDGSVSLLFIETTSFNSNDASGESVITASFRHYPNIFNSYGLSACDGKKHDPRDNPFTLKPFSLELFGCMKQGTECRELTVWSALPQSMNINNERSTQSPLDYTSETLCTDDPILDFEWISSGLVDALPWLVIFTENSALVYHRSGIQVTWQPIAAFSYKEQLCSGNPLNAFPHLVTALRCIVLQNDEHDKTMKCDWHPESILASICTEEDGAQLALKSYVRGLYSWLSQWMNPDESTRPSWDGCHGSLPIAPFRIVNDKTVLTLDSDNDDAQGPVETSANLIAALSFKPTSESKPKSQEEVLLSELQAALLSRNNAPNDNQNEKASGTHRSREFMLAMSLSKSKEDKDIGDNKKPLPIPLKDLNSDELHCIWAIGDVMSKPPSFKGLDASSQQCLFCVSLMRRFAQSKTDSSITSTKPVVNSMPSYEGGRPTMVPSPRHSSSIESATKTKSEVIASAAILSALMSNSQAKLLEQCRTSRGEKFSWETARSVGIPYWVRSSKVLASVAEEIAQTVYKSTKSVMDCALYYVAMRNMKKLRAIAATDRSDQGQKFLKFIMDNDFSSERGRNLAEKNAYSLLRKRKYVSAASFFLLAEPPMIKTALDVIKSQVNDPSLAFFVARLMDNAPKSSSPSTSVGGGALTIGGGFNLSSMGGGGGFGSTGVTDEVEDETVEFDCWEPKLGKSARSVLLPKDPPDERDVCFESLQLLWLDRPSEAKLRLSHMPSSCDKGSVMEDVPFPSVFNSRSTSVDITILQKSNKIINFCSSSRLLKRLRPKKRVLWTSALLVSRALSRCGIEIPSMRVLLTADPEYKEEEDIRSKPKKSATQATKKTTSNDTSSSIFDSFDAPPPKPKQAAQPQADSMSSSIFDSFDVPPPKPKAKQPPASDSMSSSIFDSFDAAPPKPKTTPKQVPTDPMSSSIFDSFDAAPPRSKPKPPPTDPMSSSIFDSFDAAPQKRSQTTAASSSRPANDIVVDVAEKEQLFNIPNCPGLWNEWRVRLIHIVAARRFVRELARIISSFDGEPNYPSMEVFAQRDYPIIPTAAAEVLHNACDSQGLLNSILKSLSEISTSFGVNETDILEQTLELLSSTSHPKRIVFSVIIQCMLGRGDLAEDLVRDAASCQMSSSEFLGFSNDTIVDNRDTRYYTSSLWARRESSSIIWQLELCLWLKRGGAFDMSAIAAKETLLAVRVGLAVAAWGRCHHTLETLIKAEPDCLTDFDAGKNMWRSMKIIVVNETIADGIDGVTSGGWEFLVDCRREEATEMLRDGKTGQFLIRPHSQDPGVFTLSFKTNLVPTEPTPQTNYDETAGSSATATDAPPPDPPTSPAPKKKIVKRDDVVQHAIVRLTDSGFRCGSFGPFATLVKLLHQVSDSLPFDLRFSDPPVKGIISEKGIQSSPNAFLFRKMALHSKAQLFNFQSSKKKLIVTDVDDCFLPDKSREIDLHRKFGLFAQLMFLTELRKQLCAVAAAVEDDDTAGVSHNDKQVRSSSFPSMDIDDDSLSEGSLGEDDKEDVASRMVSPLLNWVRLREIDIVDEVAPLLNQNDEPPPMPTLEFEVPPDEVVPSTIRGDTMIRRMIQSGSGVDFRTLRVGEAGNSVIVVLFDKHDAIKWLMANETENDEAKAIERLKLMELMRVVEPITSSDLSLPKSYAASHPNTESRYRFVDPWEVEALESRSGETASAALGRGRYQALNVGLIASSCEKIIRSAGGLHLLGLWSSMKGGITLTKALCSAHPAWERDAGGDLQMKKGFLMEPSPYDNSIRQHLYGNHLFRRLELPQRFLALVQVELLDLKNVTSPSGTSSLTAYALLRLKRHGSSAPLNHKARSLDSACTQARKISKSSGPHAPASWGSLVRFRFPLPEDVDCEGKSYDTDRESLFKGAPTCLQITVYEKKFMSDVELGGADVNLDSLGSGGQIEEWVPLRAGKDGITWFARIRLSLRFELLCLDSSLDVQDAGKEDLCPSVGLRKIQKLSQLGAHEDQTKQGVKNSISTPDLLGYFWNDLH